MACIQLDIQVSKSIDSKFEFNFKYSNTTFEMSPIYQSHTCLVPFD